ncbi:protein of unknown function [Thalassobacillus cyri]|uniref:Uncharacterized protein n=1 Tax=Thalassobacillus cyri TaxID=571932 RepID=A0A1H4FMP7_9BACI|nr:DUF4367 domain-containing protein [Thalassobacillus cyri]SEA98586.1 protein of unknown function [Thalassobacillus cyri]
MKLKIGLLFMLVLFTAGCSTEPNAMHTYDKTQVNDHLQEVDFDYELPEQVPFEVKSIETDTLVPDQPIFSVYFTGTNGEQMMLEVVNATLNAAKSNLFEEVKIGDRKGFFYENAQGARMLLWEKDEVHYQLKTIAGDTEALEDSQLIAIASTFK